jgi:hypothetical protein
VDSEQLWAPQVTARDPKDWVQRRDPAEVVVWRIRADTLKERADLPGPLPQIRGEKRQLLVVGYSVPVNPPLYDPFA